MASDSGRLRRLLDTQEKLKAMHEMHHAAILAQAAQAAGEAAEIAARFEDPESLSGLFPDLYVRRLKAALAREHRFREMAQKQAVVVAEHTARSRTVERLWREADRREARKRQESEILETVEQGSLRKGGWPEWNDASGA